MAAAALAVLTGWHRAAGKAGAGSAGTAVRLAVGVLGTVLLGVNAGWFALLRPGRADQDPERQRVIDQFVPGWYQMVPVWMLAGSTALVLAIALILLTSPAARRR